MTRQGDQDTTKVGKRISRAVSKVSATGFAHPPSSVGVACSEPHSQFLLSPRHWGLGLAGTDGPESGCVKQVPKLLKELWICIFLLSS